MPNEVSIATFLYLSSHVLDKNINVMLSHLIASILLMKDWKQQFQGREKWKWNETSNFCGSLQILYDHEVEMYSRPCQTPIMESSCKRVNI